MVSQFMMLNIRNSIPRTFWTRYVWLIVDKILFNRLFQLDLSYYRWNNLHEIVTNKLLYILIDLFPVTKSSTYFQGDTYILTYFKMLTTVHLMRFDSQRAICVVCFVCKISEIKYMYICVFFNTNTGQENRYYGRDVVNIQLLIMTCTCDCDNEHVPDKLPQRKE